MSPTAFEELARAFPEALVLVTGNGVILACNPPFGRLLGRPGSELPGVPLADLASADDSVVTFVRACSATRTMIPGRLVLIGADGAIRECRAEGACVRPASEGEAGVIVMRLKEQSEQNRFLLLNQKIEELTEQVRLRIRLEEERERLLSSEKQARESAEVANRLKDEFLATLSHELRTPLNAILGWASMLRAGVGSDQIERGLETIYRAAHSQLQLVDDLLDVSRIITGKLRLDLRPINVAEAVAAAVDSVEPTANAKAIRLERLIDPDPGPTSGDPGRLQQVVWNLLSNAIRFTPRGGRVQIRVERVDSHVEIIVSDTGEGIDQAVLPFIFERFRQGEGSLTRSHEGLGLGLSIVRHLVEAHGGSVHAFSDGRGAGTTFTVSLPLLVYQRRDPLAMYPLANSEDAETPSDPSLLVADRLSGLRILVVEDEPDSRDMLVRLFESVGAESHGVRTTAEALAEVERFEPHAIVSDIELLGEDGYVFARRLRTLPARDGGRIPAVALTAFARSADRVRTLDAGFQMHLQKPVEPAELIAAVASLVKRDRSVRDG